MPVQLVVGLGNPGNKYSKTRHNAGFWLLDELSDSFCFDKKFNAEFCKISISGSTVYLLKPLTFMNLSGDAVQKALSFYKISAENMLVVHDELDFNVGVCRLKKGGGHGGHNGLRDIINKISNKNFLRLRVGVGHPGDAKEVSNYVLKSPAKKEQFLIIESILKAKNAIKILMKDDLESAMKYLHSD